jgi:hypothetical protein
MRLKIAVFLTASALSPQTYSQAIDERELIATVSPGLFDPLAFAPSVGELWVAGTQSRLLATMTVPAIVSTVTGEPHSQLSLRFDGNPTTPQVTSQKDVGLRWNYYDGRISTWHQEFVDQSGSFRSYSSGTFTANGVTKLTSGFSLVETENGFRSVLSNARCQGACIPCSAPAETRARAGGGWLAAQESGKLRMLRISPTGELLESHTIYEFAPDLRLQCALHRDKSNLLRFSFSGLPGAGVFTLDDSSRLRTVGAHRLPRGFLNSYNITGDNYGALPGGDILTSRYDESTRQTIVTRIAPGRYENNQWIAEPTERFSYAIP